VDSVATAAVTQHRTAGVSVAVVKNGRTVLAKGYGFADLENDVPATARLLVMPERQDADRAGRACCSFLFRRSRPPLGPHEHAGTLYRDDEDSSLRFATLGMTNAMTGEQ